MLTKTTNVTTVAGMFAGPSAGQLARERAHGKYIAAEQGQAYKPSYNEKVADAQAKAERKQAKAAAKAAKMKLRLPFQLFASSYAQARDVLCSGLFRTGIGPRIEFIKKEILVSAAGGTIRHSGPELRQDDGGVFMALLAKTRGDVLTKTVSFCPRALVKEMGREAKHGHYSIAHLRECIERLQSSTLAIKQGNSFLNVVMVPRFNGDSQLWTVRFDDTVARLFRADEKHPTYINIKQRAQLTDGMQTMLQGYFFAMWEEHEFSLVGLHTFSKSAMSMKVFGREVRKALPRLVAAGVIKSYTTPRGCVRIVRV